MNDHQKRSAQGEAPGRRAFLESSLIIVGGLVLPPQANAILKLLESNPSGLPLATDRVLSAKESADAAMYGYLVAAELASKDEDGTQVRRALSRLLALTSGGVDVDLGKTASFLDVTVAKVTILPFADDGVGPVPFRVGSTGQGAALALDAYAALQRSDGNTHSNRLQERAVLQSFLSIVYNSVPETWKADPELRANGITWDLSRLPKESLGDLLASREPVDFLNFAARSLRDQAISLGRKGPLPAGGSSLETASGEAYLIGAVALPLASQALGHAHVSKSMGRALSAGLSIAAAGAMLALGALTGPGFAVAVGGTLIGLLASGGPSPEIEALDHIKSQLDDVRLELQGLQQAIGQLTGYMQYEFAMMHSQLQALDLALSKVSTQITNSATRLLSVEANLLNALSDAGKQRMKLDLSALRSRTESCITAARSPHARENSCIGGSAVMLGDLHSSATAVAIAQSAAPKALGEASQAELFAWSEGAMFPVLGLLPECLTLASQPTPMISPVPDPQYWADAAGLYMELAVSYPQAAVTDAHVVEMYELGKSIEEHTSLAASGTTLRGLAARYATACGIFLPAPFYQSGSASNDKILVAAPPEELNDKTLIGRIHALGGEIKSGFLRNGEDYAQMVTSPEGLAQSVSAWPFDIELSQIALALIICSSVAIYRIGAGALPSSSASLGITRRPIRGGSDASVILRDWARWNFSDWPKTAVQERLKYLCDGGMKRALIGYVEAYLAWVFGLAEASDRVESGSIPIVHRTLGRLESLARLNNIDLNQ